MSSFRPICSAFAPAASSFLRVSGRSQVAHSGASMPIRLGVTCIVLRPQRQETSASPSSVRNRSGSFHASLQGVSAYLPSLMVMWLAEVVKVLIIVL